MRAPHQRRQSHPRLSRHPDAGFDAGPCRRDSIFPARTACWWMTWCPAARRQRPASNPATSSLPSTAKRWTTDRPATGRHRLRAWFQRHGESDPQRGGKDHHRQAGRIAGQRSRAEQRAAKPPRSPPTPTPWTACTVDDLSPDARQQLQIPDGVKGAIVTDVDQDSNAADAGLQQNDVIVEINHHAVTSSQDAVNLCMQAKTKRILVKIWRRGDRRSRRHALLERGQHQDEK